MIKTCSNSECKNEFDAVRATKLYCSDRCKKIVQRGLTGTKPIPTGTESSDKILSGTKQNPAGFDDPYSPDYDLTEEGYVRRNKNWGDFSDRFKDNIREGAIRIKKNIQAELAALRMSREGPWVNPVINSKLAPKGR